MEQIKGLLSMYSGRKPIKTRIWWAVMFSYICPQNQSTYTVVDCMLLFSILYGRLETANRVCNACTWWCFWSNSSQNQSSFWIKLLIANTLDFQSNRKKNIFNILHVYFLNIYPHFSFPKLSLSQSEQTIYFRKI